MKETFKNIFRDRIIFWTFSLSLLLLIAVVIYIVIVYPQLPPVIPLYNRLSWGYSRLGSKGELFIPVGISVLFFIINLVTSAIVYKRIVLISRMVSAISFTLTLCTSIYILKIMQLVL